MKRSSIYRQKDLQYKWQDYLTIGEDIKIYGQVTQKSGKIMHLLTL